MSNWIELDRLVDIDKSDGWEGIGDRQLCLEDIGLIHKLAPK